jgi:hypothetical protein
MNQRIGAERIETVCPIHVEALPLDHRSPKPLDRVGDSIRKRQDRSSNGLFGRRQEFEREGWAPIHLFGKQQDELEQLPRRHPKLGLDHGLNQRVCVKHVIAREHPVGRWGLPWELLKCDPR